ncbi:sensor histidine kinase [Streptomyces sp. NPDC001774]
MTAFLLGLTDVIVIIMLQELCNGSLLLVVALFIFPILAAFHGRPALATATIASGSAIYGVTTLSNPSLFLTAESDRAIAITVLYCLVSVCCVIHSAAYAKHIARIAQLLSDRSILLAEVMSAEERERARLAEFIHDGPLQSVLAARFALEQATGEKSRETIHRTSAELLDVARQLRRTTGQLYPEVLKEIGLADAILSLLRAMNERTGIRYRASIADTRSKPFEPLVFAAVRELVENVVRHSGATHAWITLEDSGESLELTVSDNGIGAGPKLLHKRLAQGHIGLASLRVRVEAAGGSLRFFPMPHSSGTCVRVTLPLAPASARETQENSCSKRLRTLVRRRDTTTH